MFSCDYNGWADVPEEEREAIDAFEVEQTAVGVLAYPPALRSKPGQLSGHERSRRRAA
jgi:hypothetical protein